MKMVAVGVTKACTFNYAMVFVFVIGDLMMITMIITKNGNVHSQHHPRHKVKQLKTIKTMVVKYGIMSNKWSVESDDKLVCYAAILIHIGHNGYNMVMLYNEECKNDQWAFCSNIEKRLKEIFGVDVFEFMDAHENEIRSAIKTIKKLV